MRYLVILLLLAGAVKADPLLTDLDFNEGQWEMAAVSLHNYKPNPLQKELRTFMLDNKEVLMQMQQSWNFEPFYEDNCDYHYALKFYKDNELQKTLLINLECNYISDGMFSFSFTADQLLKFKADFKIVPWSFIQFRNIRSLRRAITKIQPEKSFYFYHDIEPYRHDGRFILRTTNHTWQEDIDSVKQVLADYIAHQAGSSDFYIQSKVLFVDEHGKFTYHHEVFCSQAFAETYLAADERNLVAGWRSHYDLVDQNQKYITLVVIGINEPRFRRLMRG